MPGDLAAADEHVVRILDRRAPAPIAAATASAATSVISGQRATGGDGRRTTEIARPLPGSSTQTRPSRPRPLVWCSATATVPCGASAGAMIWVEGVSSGVQVDAAEAAAETRQNELGHECHRH